MTALHIHCAILKNGNTQLLTLQGDGFIGQECKGYTDVLNFIKGLLDSSLDSILRGHSVSSEISVLASKARLGKNKEFSAVL